jgi:hypothetical protein
MGAVIYRPFFEERIFENKIFRKIFGPKREEVDRRRK